MLTLSYSVKSPGFDVAYPGGGLWALFARESVTNMAMIGVIPSE